MASDEKLGKMAKNGSAMGFWGVSPPGTLYHMLYIVAFGKSWIRIVDMAVCITPQYTARYVFVRHICFDDIV